MNKERKNPLDGFTEEELTVFFYRYGNEGRIHKSLSEISKIMGITRERVRQIEVNYNKKLAYYFTGSTVIEQWGYLTILFYRPNITLISSFT